MENMWKIQKIQYNKKIQLEKYDKKVGKIQ